MAPQAPRDRPEHGRDLEHGTPGERHRNALRPSHKAARDGRGRTRTQTPAHETLTDPRTADHVFLTGRKKASLGETVSMVGVLKQLPGVRQDIARERQDAA